jgi:hypothetical protein
MPSCRILRRVALVKTNVSEERSTSIISVTRIRELGTSVVTSNRCTLRKKDLLLTLLLEHRFLPPWWRRLYVLPTRRFLQEPDCVTSQKTTILTSAPVYIRITCHFLPYVALHWVQLVVLPLALGGLARVAGRIANCQRRVIRLSLQPGWNGEHTTRGSYR